MTMPADTSALLMLVVHATWQATILLILVAIIAKIFGRFMAAKWHAVLWSVPVLRFVFLIVPATSLSLFHWLPTPIGGEEFGNGELMQKNVVVAKAESASRLPAQTLQPGPATAVDSLENVEQHETKTVNDVENGTANGVNNLGVSALNRDVASSDHKQSSPDFLPLTILVLVIWAFGFGLMICRWLVRHSLLTQLIKGSDKLQDPIWLAMISRCRSKFNILRSITCYVSDEISAPATSGFLRPIILLPSDSINQLEPSEAEMIIAHELSHVKRCDAILTLFTELAKAIHWFNPFVYVADKKVRQSIELATDEATIERIGSDRLESYIELVLKFATRHSNRQHLGILSMAGSKSKLKQRLSTLVDRPANSWMRNSRLSAVLSCTIAIILTATGLTTGAQSTSTDELTGDAQDQIENQTSTSPSSKTANDQSPATDEDVHTASGTVVDDNGKPVAGALVLHQYFRDGENKDVQAVTDESGQFTIKFPPDMPNFHTYYLWAYKEGYPVRTVSAGAKIAGIKLKPRSGLEIRLPPKQSFDYRIFNSDGSPFAEQDVFVRYVYVPNGTYAANEPTGLSEFTPDLLMEKTKMKTDHKGRLTVRSFTKALTSRFMVYTPKTGKQHISIAPNQNPEATLRPVGSLRGEILAENVSKYGGMKIYVYTENSDRGPRIDGYSVAELDAEGKFDFPALATGALRLNIEWKPGFDVYPLIIPPQPQIEEGKTLVLESQSEPARMIDLVGRVIYSDSRYPAASIPVKVRDVRGESSPTVITDMAGNFAATACEGDVSISIRSLGKGGEVYQKYSHPKGLVLQISADEKSPYKIQDIIIPQKPTVKGKLLNEKGEPAAAVEIVLTLNSHGLIYGRATTTTDGTFEMPVRSKKLRLDQTRGPFFALFNTSKDYGKVGGHQKLKVIRSDEQDLLLQITK